MSVEDAPRHWLRRLRDAVLDLVPQRPSSDGPPPDIDGRRPSTPDPEALRRVERARKDGRGGYR